MRRNSLAVLVVALSFAALTIDLRYLHRFATRTTWYAYIPAAYCALASLALLCSLTRWERIKRIASWICAGGLLVGGIGLAHHTRGNPMQVVETLDVTAPRAVKPAGSTRATSAVAPLSLAGLGMLGFVLVRPGARKATKATANRPRLAIEGSEVENLSEAA